MKRTLILTSLLIAALSLSAFAGPLIGLSFVPATGSDYAQVYFGWQSANDWQAIIGHSNLDTWMGDWSLGAFWTPVLWSGSVNLKAGGTTNFSWDKHGQIAYEGLGLSLGAERWITEQMGIYGELEISNNASKTYLSITPVVGFEINLYSVKEKSIGP